MCLILPPIYVHIIKFSHDTQFNCNENQTRTFLKNYDRNGLPLLFCHTRKHTHTHSLPFLLRKKIASFPMSLSQKSKCDLSAYKYTILHFIQHTPVYTSISMCVRVCAHLFLKLYLYKYHLSVHVHIYLTNTYRSVAYKYFLSINRTYIFAYSYACLSKYQPF